MKILSTRTSFYLSLIILLVSCGQEVPRTDQSFSNLGNILAVNESESLSSSEKDLLIKACNSLKSKETYLNNYLVNNDFSLTFTQSNSECGAEASESEAVFNIDNGDNSALEFVSETSSPLFKYVETASKGAMRDFCSQLSSEEGVMRYKLTSGVYQVINLFTDRSTECSGDTDTVCAVVQTAYEKEDGNYKVEEVVKLTIDNDEDSSPRGLVQAKELAQICQSDTEKKSTRIMKIKAD